MPDHWVPKTIVGLTAHTIGGVWGSDPGEDEVDIPVFRQTEFDDFGHLSQPAGAIRSVTERQLSSRTLEEGDVLIQKSAGTPTLPGRVVRVPALSNAATFSNFLSLLRPDRSQVVADFYFLILQQHHASGVAYEFQRGTNIRNLDLKSYLATTVSIPPMSEQRRIVDLVESIDNYIDALQGQIDANRTVEKALREEIFDHLWERAEGSELGDLVEIDRGSSPRPIDKYIRKDGSGVPWIRIGDATDESMFISKTKDTITLEGFATPRFVEPGDFLLSNSMSFGRPYISKIHGCIHDGWLRFSKIEAAFTAEFLYNMMLCSRLQKEFASLAAGSGVRNLKIEKVKSVTVPKISRREQEEIVDVLSTTRAAEAALTLQLNNLQNVRSGFLTDLLSGDRLLDESYDKAVGW